MSVHTGNLILMFNMRLKPILPIIQNQFTSQRISAEYKSQILLPQMTVEISFSILRTLNEIEQT